MNPSDQEDDVTTVNPHTTSATSAVRPSRRAMFEPLVLDLAVPVGLYYGLHSGAHVSIVLALTVASVVPLLRTGQRLRCGERLDNLALLILAVNVVGILATLVSGDPRLLFAKNSAISSVIALAILGSTFLGRPIMTAGLEPWMTRGEEDRMAAWNRLRGSERFRRYERRFGLVWGGALLSECVARLISAFTLPIPTLAWLSTALLIAAIVIATIIGGVVAANPMQELIDSEVER